MGFDHEYYSEWRKTTAKALPPDGSTILPFFGFSYSVEKDIRYKKVGGEWEITPNNTSGYTMKQSPTFWDSDTYERAKYTRSGPQPQEASFAENKFYNHIKMKYTNILGKFDPFKTPSIALSVDDYYQHNKPNTAGNIGCGFVLFLLIIFFAALIYMDANPAVFQNYDWVVMTESGELEFAEGVLDKIIPAIVFGCPVLYFLIAWLVSLFTKDIDSFYDLPVDKQEKVRRKYYKTLASAYGEEGKEILIEYLKAMNRA